MLVRGDTLGTYRVEETIGKGGMCIVYQGTHTLLERPVAIKVLSPEHSRSKEIVTRFFNEARALTKIADPGIVQVFDFGHHTDGNAYLVMELLRGDPISRRLATQGRFAPREAVRLTRLMSASMAVAHSHGVIHRDLKPENIFLVRDAAALGGERPKILDFGIAKVTFDDQALLQTRTNALMGTPGFMSPEQCRGAKNITAQSDIYSLGCVLFTMLTGRTLFERELPGDVLVAHVQEPAPELSKVLPALAGPLDAVIARCLKKQPSDRFTTMEELGQALAAIEESLPATVEGPLTVASLLDGSTVSLRGSAVSALEANRASTTLNSAVGQVRTPGEVPRRPRRPLVLGAVGVTVVLAGALLGSWIVGRADPAAPRRPIAPAAPTAPAASSSPSAPAPASSSPSDSASTAIALPSPSESTSTAGAEGANAPAEPVLSDELGSVPSDVSGGVSGEEPSDKNEKKPAIKPKKGSRRAALELDANGLPVHR